MSKPNERVVAHKLAGVALVQDLDTKIAEHRKSIAELESAKRQLVEDARSLAEDFPDG